VIDDFQIAVHEAGHVLASYMLLSVNGASIEHINGRYGLTWSNSVDLEPDANNFAALDNVWLRHALRKEVGRVFPPFNPARHALSGR
jgi:hypothetical protein